MSEIGKMRGELRETADEQGWLGYKSGDTEIISEVTQKNREALQPYWNLVFENMPVSKSIGELKSSVSELAMTSIQEGPQNGTKVFEQGQPTKEELEDMILSRFPNFGFEEDIYKLKSLSEDEKIDMILKVRRNRIKEILGKPELDVWVQRLVDDIENGDTNEYIRRSKIKAQELMLRYENSRKLRDGTFDFSKK